MVITRRLFLSFAAQEAPNRDRLVSAAKEGNLPCSFSEVSIKVPEDSFWQQHCRSKILQCDALVVLLGDYTCHARGVLWEVACARKAALPVYAIRFGEKGRTGELPSELRGVTVFDWSAGTVEELLARL
ncbi:MAG TPA: TIR domain-containing protein [Opitutaceae bacterium]